VCVYVLHRHQCPGVCMCVYICYIHISSLGGGYVCYIRMNFCVCVCVCDIHISVLVCVCMCVCNTHEFPSVYVCVCVL